MVARKKFPHNLGKINKPIKPSINKLGVKISYIWKTSPLENLHIAELINNRLDIVEELPET